ncbi:MAG: carbohydrate ABC transporter permease [Hyphomicrobiales bacterium]|nr:MAG: carbohydrate ABC transporter permease [Hyphomicrobiales bacterium]
MTTSLVQAARPGLSASNILRQVALWGGLLVMLYPIAWMLLASFRPQSEILSDPAGLPSQLILDNYVRGWTGTGRSFSDYFVNSLIVSLGAVIGNTLACSMAAYVFARLEFPFRRTLFAVMLVTIMLPYQVTLVPQYMIFRQLGWLDTFLPLVVPKFLAIDGFFIFLMVQFIRGLPRELDEAARIDGCGNVGVFFRIILPLLTPALITTALFTFIWTYDDFFGQLIYLSSPKNLTVQLGLRVFMDASSDASYGPLLAMSVLAIIPVIIFFVIFQRRLVEGIATSGLKG